MSEDYSLLLKQAESLLAAETDAIANAANLASLIYHGIKNINWAGFYFLKGGELVLGPFCGQVACTRIAVGNGVCGTAFAQQDILVVDDVRQFAGHIACDAESKSEMVLPFNCGKLAGVLDIDSPLKSRFADDKLKLAMQAALKIYENSVSQYRESPIIGQ